MRAHLPDKRYFIGKELPGMPGYLIVEHRGSGSNAHVFRAHSEAFNNSIACKIIPRANLKTDWKTEVLKATALSSRHVVNFIQDGKWTDPETGIDCVTLCWEYISGQSLREYLRENAGEISMSFVDVFLGTMLDLFRDMGERSIVHGDFHGGNILVADRRESLVPPRFEFRVTDFGVTSATSGAELRDDYEQLALLLRDLLENVDYSASSSRERFTFDVLNNDFVGRHLVEKDPTRDPLARNPTALFERMQEITREYTQLAAARSGVSELRSPFDYLSCEQIGEAHSLLKALYSSLFLGLSEIEGRNNLVLTGPRGCGKTTVYKSLSLDHVLLTEVRELDRLSYIGVYYRCDDLYFTFPRYKLPEFEAAYDIPLHFVTVTLVAGLLSSLRRWAEVHFSEDFIRDEAAATDSLWKALDWDPPRSPDALTFRALETRLRKERRRAAERHRFANDPKQRFGTYLGPGALPAICHALQSGLPFLERRPFYFFIDDYSVPKVTAELQENLNRLFMQRCASCFFKLSTESPVSYSRSDIDGKVYVEGREFELLNLGLTFIHADHRTKLAFIEDVFRRRFKAISEFPVEEIGDLTGSVSPLPSDNAIARAIRQGKKQEVMGKDALANLCSGDIHYLIRLVGQMVIAVGGLDNIKESESRPMIPSEVQNKAVRDEAGNFLESLRGIQEWGEQLVAVVTAFGNVASSYLRYRDSKNVQGAPPHQASRIEPYAELELSAEAQRIYNELLRYSVFIVDMRGKSQRGKIVPRLYLRRFLIPHFNITFSKRDSIRVEPSEIEELLLRPSEFERKHILKSAEMKGQESMFSVTGDEEE